LIIEIISPSSLKRDKIDKLVTYADFRIPEYWIVDPKLASLELHLLKGDSYELINIFQNDETIVSPTIKCILFTMETIMSNIPRLE
ncbi:MAG TPA: Uma2 family endonuclease, partial [Bacillota bacterium]|nr:Uma2 family endonuclease [Bacillota bacterium]